MSQKGIAQTSVKQSSFLDIDIEQTNQQKFR